MTATDGGAAGWPVYIPGDPGALRQASHGYGQAAQEMALAAGQLRANLGMLTTWEGQGAEAHAIRAQALAAAHQVGAQALNYGATTLAVYAGQLEEAQALAVRANSAHDLAAQLALQVSQAEAAMAEANQAAAAAQASVKAGGPGHAGQTVPTPPTSQSQAAISAASYAAARLAHLQQEWSAQCALASSLAAQARAMAQAAAARAATAFERVAALAGNPALHANPDPFVAYLGAGKPGQAAAMIQGSLNLGGNPAPAIEGLGVNAKGKPVATFTPGGDTQALADLAADPSAGADNRSLAAVYNKTNSIYTRALRKEHAILGTKHITADQLPTWVSDLSPVTQAAVLYQLIKHIPSGAWADTLHIISLVAGGGAAVLTFASLVEGGLNPYADTGAAVTDGIEAAADGEISEGLASVLRVVNLNRAASGLGIVSLGADVGGDKISGHWDIPELALDSLAVLPGLGALRADMSVYRTTAAIDDTEADLAELAPGGEDYTAVKSSLEALKAGKASKWLLGKALAVYSWGGGVGAFTYGAANLGLELSGNTDGAEGSTSPARGRHGRGAPRPRGSSVPATPVP